MIEMAQHLRAICRPHGVPLIVNDRVDVALASEADGVHLGQNDMSLVVARRILGQRAIIGVTVSSSLQAAIAVKEGADYLGIGTVFATPTKEDAKSIIGVAGVRDILASIPSEVPTVAIGGINADNVQRVIYQSQAEENRLSGVAVVSAIVAADHVQTVAQELLHLIRSPPTFIKEVPNKLRPVELLLDQVNNVIKQLALKHPLCHNMTNFVVQNFAANVALAIPIMANNGDEAPELAALGGALVINMGSVMPEAINNYVKAVQAYNACGQPVLFDPVGAGATSLRRRTVQTLMANGYFDVIKGNENEIRVLLGDDTTQQKGVDSGASKSTIPDMIHLARSLAERERNVVVLTGETDIISDGDRTYAVKNGDEYLGQITGSGCTLGTTIAACLAVHREDRLLAALSGMLLYEIASERASGRTDVKGPGTFVPAFIDELNAISKLAQESNDRWTYGARLVFFEKTREASSQTGT
ncbi:MAG: hypothetical protein Q9170_007926 [Blastenia crenularia]